MFCVTHKKLDGNSAWIWVLSNLFKYLLWTFDANTMSNERLCRDLWFPFFINWLGDEKFNDFASHDHFRNVVSQSAHHIKLIISQQLLWTQWNRFHLCETSSEREREREVGLGNSIFIVFFSSTTNHLILFKMSAWKSLGIANYVDKI